MLNADEEAHTQFDRYSDFYQAEYGNHIRRMSSLGPLEFIDIYQPGGDFSDKGTQDIVIQRCLSRVGVTANLGDGRFSASAIKGGLFVSPPDFDNEIILDDHHRVDIVSINWKHIEHIRRTENTTPSPDFGHVHSRMTHDSQMNKLFDRLWQLDAVNDAIEVESSILWISHRLDAWRDWPHRRPSAQVEKLSRGALNRCIERLDVSTNDPATLEELAALSQLSMFHFCRAFKAATGLPPHRYQILRKIERARDLLANTPLSVAEVANAVGYEDVTYFTRLFRRETGFPPGQWRRERLRRVSISA